MTKEYALKRIHNKVEKLCPNERTSTKVWLEEVVYMTFEGLEMDNDYEHHSSMDNLRFAIEVNLEDEFELLLEEARKETK